MAKVMVTGASGHIGSNVVRSLLAEGHRVVALVRPTSDRAGLEGLEVELATGDVLDRQSLAAAARGAEHVIHCAANFAIWAPDPAQIVAPAVDGTRNVIEIAAEAGVRRVVATSSSAAVGGSPSADQVRTEADWFEDPTVPYYRAKVEAERVAHEVGRDVGVEVVTLCPSLVLGPHDHRCTPSMKPILDIANGRGPTVDGGCGVVSVRDVARAHVLALTRGNAGERYLVSGDNCTLVELGRMVESLTGTHAKHLALPRWAFLTVAALMEAGAALTGRAPAMTRAAVRDVLGKFAWYDATKARTVLGLSPMPAEAVVRETVEWFLEKGWLDAKVAERTRERLAALPAKAA